MRGCGEGWLLVVIRRQRRRPRSITPPGGLLTYGEDTPVPLDRWFELEVYVLRDPTEGAVKVWLDGEMIFDVENIRTKNDTDTWFTKLADVDAQPAPFELWVDDVEIWTR
jgi:hypothetical protein